MLYLPIEDRPIKKDYDQKQLKHSWTALIVTALLILVWSYIVFIYNGYDIPNGFIATFVIIGFIGIIVGLIWWLGTAWDHYTSEATHARIMYVNRWSYTTTAYETVYFVEWQYERKKWFMGKLLMEQTIWSKTDYSSDKGIPLKEDARERIMTALKEMKPKRHIKDIQEIEVFIVAEELAKITVE